MKSKNFQVGRCLIWIMDLQWCSYTKIIGRLHDGSWGAISLNILSRVCVKRRMKQTRLPLARPCTTEGVLTYCSWSLGNHYSCSKFSMHYSGTYTHSAIGSNKLFTTANDDQYIAALGTHCEPWAHFEKLDLLRSQLGFNFICLERLQFGCSLCGMNLNSIDVVRNAWNACRGLVQC